MNFVYDISINVSSNIITVFVWVIVLVLMASLSYNMFKKLLKRVAVETKRVIDETIDEMLRIVKISIMTLKQMLENIIDAKFHEMMIVYGKLSGCQKGVSVNHKFQTIDDGWNGLFFTEPVPVSHDWEMVEKEMVEKEIDEEDFVVI